MDAKLLGVIDAFVDLLDSGNDSPTFLRQITGMPEERCQQIHELWCWCMSEEGVKVIGNARRSVIPQLPKGSENGRSD